ncbi:MAG: hypothetical protein EAX90_12715 [Candidatus Heimdallarchaeota archaeon]|nr:hypothetical protein [Candidatus Heimdallarchaeota archaeon]
MISKLILLKAHLELKKYKKKLDDPMAHQQKILFEILRRNKYTEYGTVFRFSSIKNFKDFQKYVPLEDYFQRIYYFERSFERDNVLTHDPIVHWVQSTGTSGTPKILPITQSDIQKYSEGNSRQFFSYLLDKSENSKALSGKIFTYIGQSRLDQIRGIPVGYISGIAAERVTNPILLKRLVPSIDIVNIENWKERLWQTTLDVISHDVTIVAGITPMILGFLTTIQTALPFQLEQIQDSKIRTKVQNSIFGDTIDFKMLWPNLQYLASSGVMVESYKSLIKDLLGDISVFEMYAASEGHYAFQMHEDDPSLYLNFDNYFFEFRDPEDTSKVYLLNEVKEDTPYEMIVTNSSGLYRYNMHDIVRFTSLDPPKILVQGRTGNILNIGNEKVSEDQLALVISEAMNTLESSSVDFVLSSTMALPLRHKIYIELAKIPKNPEKKAEQMSIIYDELLKRLNTCYDISRGLEALSQPEIHLLKKGSFRKITERKAEKTDRIEHTKILHIIQPEKLKKIIDEEMIFYSYVPNEESK